MRIFKSTLGLSNQWFVLLTMLPSTIAVWLPVEISQQTGVILILTAIVMALITFFILKTLPKPSILVSSDDFTIIDRFSSKTFDELSEVRFYDQGQVSGWSMSLHESTKRSRPMRIPLSQIQGQETLVGHIFANAERVKTSYKSKLFGSSFEWLVSLEAAILLTGIVRLMLIVAA